MKRSGKQQRFVQQLVAPRLAPWMTQPFPVNDPIQLAVAGGAGWFAGYAEKALLTLGPGVKIAAIVDSNVEGGQTVAGNLGAAFYPTIEAALAGVKLDGVVDETHNASHGPVARAVLQAGKALYNEKPLLPRIFKDQRAEVLRLILASPFPTAVPFTYLFSPEFRKAKELIDAGVIGDVLWYNLDYLQGWLAIAREVWRAAKEQGGEGGVLDDIGVHVLAVLIFFGEEILRLRCDAEVMVDDQNRKVYDHANITAQCVSNAKVSIRVSQVNHAHGNWPRVEIGGTNGTIRISPQIGAIELWRTNKSPCHWIAGQAYDAESDGLGQFFPDGPATQVDPIWRGIAAEHGDEGLVGTLAWGFRAWLTQVQAAREVVRATPAGTTPAPWKAPKAGELFQVPLTWAALTDAQVDACLASIADDGGWQKVEYPAALALNP
jgi:predicted dehydrogenase